MSAELLSRVGAEIDARIAQLRPAIAEYEDLLRRGEELDREAAAARRREPAAPRGVAEQAIVAALEHGSHTVSELVLVTAMPAGELRHGVRRLQRAGTVTRTTREGRTAYALNGAATA